MITVRTMSGVFLEDKVYVPIRYSTLIMPPSKRVARFYNSRKRESKKRKDSRKKYTMVKITSRWTDKNTAGGDRPLQFMRGPIK